MSHTPFHRRQIHRLTHTYIYPYTLIHTHTHPYTPIHAHMRLDDSVSREMDSRTLCLLVPSDMEIKPNDSKAIIGQSAFKFNRKHLCRARNRPRQSYQIKSYGGVRNGILYVAWLRGYWYNINPTGQGI